jgi:hypothetical protein
MFDGFDYPKNRMQMFEFLPVLRYVDAEQAMAVRVES